MYADLHCPYAYLAAWRLRQVLPEFGDRIVVEHRSLAIEYLDRKVTPKDILDAESALILLDAPDAPFAPWDAPAWTWPVTMWPAFEAVKVAERQGWKLAHELDWRLREAFFGRSRCIAMRHVILEEARGVRGLETRRFADELDAGIAKRRVLDEAQEGWEKLQLDVSPTFVTPAGQVLPNPAGPTVELDEESNCRVVHYEPSPPDALDAYREMLRACIS